MDIPDITCQPAESVTKEIRTQVLEPFIAATRTVLGEMASTDVGAAAMVQTPLDYARGGLSAVLGLRSATEGFLVLSFPKETAAALAARVLAEVTRDLDEDLIRDCVGEIGNVIAGQAKALLADTPYRFSFSVPTVVTGAYSELRPKQGQDCFLILFKSTLGQFALQIVLSAGP